MDLRDVLRRFRHRTDNHKRDNQVAFSFKVNPFSTWSCHVCREERPDRFISVLTKAKIVAGALFQENVRYCNDRPECREGAEDFSFIKEEHDRMEA